MGPGFMAGMLLLTFAMTWQGINSKEGTNKIEFTDKKVDYQLKIITQILEENQKKIVELEHSVRLLQNNIGWPTMSR